MSQERLSRLPQEEVDLQNGHDAEEIHLNAHYDSAVEVDGQYADTRLDGYGDEQFPSFQPSFAGQAAQATTFTTTTTTTQTGSWSPPSFSSAPSPRMADGSWSPPLSPSPQPSSPSGYYSQTMPGSWTQPQMGTGSWTLAPVQGGWTQPQMAAGSWSQQPTVGQVYPQGIPSPPVYSVGTTNQPQQYSLSPRHQGMPSQPLYSVDITLYQGSPHTWHQSASGGYQPPGVQAPYAPQY
mmetsp:Transcript_89719/g.158801  ORF Transcript_89719/g.158801 Transcript_89719/m.158801 type:complete len:237 (-) Transcript_89719:125-835(-)